jgi:NAD(P)-dependent dehydrogenase (short-subunit alcohol dehydrogenase family)
MDSYGPTPFLDGKVAIVTGAAQGNGFAIAERLAQHGCGIAAIDINAEGIKAAAARLDDSGKRVRPFVADCSVVPAIRKVVGETLAAFGRIDIIVNNAGILRIAAFPDIGEEDFDATVNLNLKGAFFFVQEAQSALTEGGRVVNIASVAGVDGRTLSPPYAATKSGIITITKTLARALAPRGITVNAIAPGLIDTPFNHILDQKIGVEKQGLKPGEMLAKRAAEIPLGRIGKPEDVAGVAAFLVSPDASYITGETIIVAGGWVID